MTCGRMVWRGHGLMRRTPLVAGQAAAVAGEELPTAAAQAAEQAMHALDGLRPAGALLFVSGVDAVGASAELQAAVGAVRQQIGLLVPLIGGCGAAIIAPREQQVQVASSGVLVVLVGS
ncbi:MAG: hypothetical protein HC837_07080 [Chloroflexaceae bacterium]|nr:hypothetical protein [Chloroflexaceae bacterium]